MVNPGVRPSPQTSLALVLVLGVLAAGCQSAMSIDEAKKVTATFADSPLLPPPRTINDVTTILDQQKRFESQTPARLQADATAPNTTDRAVLADFYFNRGRAAEEVGRARQEIDDLTKALEYSRPGLPPPRYKILYYLSRAEMRGASVSRAIEHRRQAIDAAPPLSWQLVLNADLVEIYAFWGDLESAEAALTECSRLYHACVKDAAKAAISPAAYTAYLAQAQAALLEAKGKHAEAETLYRQAAAALAADPLYDRHPLLDLEHASLARTLIHQGRLLEAENEARKALLGALAKRGRYSPHSARMLGSLVWVLREQGRYGESETLARAAVEIYEKTGATSDSLLFAQAREQLAMALQLQGRYWEALEEYEAIRVGLGSDSRSLDALLGGHIGYAEALLKTGHVDRALERLDVALERSKRLVGGDHRNTAEIRASRALAYAAKGDAARALQEFREATPFLLRRAPDVDDEATRPLAADQRLVALLSSYIGLLADAGGTPLERDLRVDATSEAFRLADVARGRSVQRALNASAARAAATSPALADLTRREQDARKQINALYVLLANLLSRPNDQQNARVVADLRGRIEAMRRALAALTAQIEKEFPAYATLIDPKPVTVEEARAMLRPGEALIATLVTEERTFVWALPQRGPVSFAAVQLSRSALEEAVATLRKSLEPRAKTLGDIPDFDLTVAHGLYSALLEPVRSGWQNSRSLLLVAHGPLGQLPLALLPTGPATLPAESGALFSNYRHVPWLVRSHAVTILPSVSSLGTLRTIPPGDQGRRPFIGFGDPYFSKEQAALSDKEETTYASARERQQSDVIALTTRAVPITFRSSPEAFDSSQLAKLPRLPDTAEEIRSLATAMDADLKRDVFLGARANEEAVKTTDLASYRIVAFATHGLVPGDLDGLTQPALALSAPDVTGGKGDGLLTMDEILSLRMNADWVVLSACNTASGQGAGAEAVSGLGRAFFYAGARTLLVSNWPVETISARVLTTDLFRRQQEGGPGVSRAAALQETLNWLIDHGTFVDPASGQVVFSYAHPIFWAPFTLIGDGGSRGTAP
jgi:CHAT domain-containing protein